MNTNEIALVAQYLHLHVDPSQAAAWLSLLGVLSLALGRAFHHVITSGGIKGILSAIWCGTNLPRVLVLGLALAAFAASTGCGFTKLKSSVYDPTTGKLVQRTSGLSYDLFDAKTSIEKLRATSGGKTNGVAATTIGLSGLQNESSSVGVQELAKTAGGTVINLMVPGLGSSLSGTVTPANLPPLPLATNTPNPTK